MRLLVVREGVDHPADGLSQVLPEPSDAVRVRDRPVSTLLDPLDQVVEFDTAVVEELDQFPIT